MEVKIGVTHANRELTLETSHSPDEIQTAVSDALTTTRTAHADRRQGPHRLRAGSKARLRRDHRRVGPQDGLHGRVRPDVCTPRALRRRWWRVVFAMIEGRDHVSRHGAVIIESNLVVHRQCGDPVVAPRRSSSSPRSSTAAKGFKSKTGPGSTPSGPFPSSVATTAPPGFARCRLDGARTGRLWHLPEGMRSRDGRLPWRTGVGWLASRLTSRRRRSSAPRRSNRWGSRPAHAGSRCGSVLRSGSRARTSTPALARRRRRDHGCHRRLSGSRARRLQTRPSSV